MAYGKSIELFLVNGMEKQLRYQELKCLRAIERILLKREYISSFAKKMMEQIQYISEKRKM